MRIIKNVAVPTGNILIGQGEKGLLEFLSLGDYGKDVNLAEKPVAHTNLMPLQDKWVITVSTQYGCSMNCEFCDVPKVGPGRNASFADMQGQILAAMGLHLEVPYSNRLNIHFARMGEPTWNPAVIGVAAWLKRVMVQSRVHPVVSTMMPRRNSFLAPFLHAWMQIKNEVYRGNAGLQISINSTNEAERQKMFAKNACTLQEIEDIMDSLVPPRGQLAGRKITLNFAVAEYEIDPDALLRHFDPANYIVKLTPMHKTATALDNQVKTAGDYTQPYPYQHHAEALRKAGFEVLVFIASREEDEGRITCGNAILSGTEPFGKGVFSRGGLSDDVDPSQL